MDVKTTILNGNINETICMAQSENFVSEDPNGLQTKEIKLWT